MVSKVNVLVPGYCINCKIALYGGLYVFYVLFSYLLGLCFFCMINEFLGIIPGLLIRRVISQLYCEFVWNFMFISPLINVLVSLFVTSNVYWWKELL
jgi:hypothetical protein